MSYALLMEDETIDPESAVHDDLMEDDGSDIAEQEQDEGYAQTAMNFEYRHSIAVAMQESLLRVRHNNDSVVGVLQAMSACGIGGRTTLSGLEAANNNVLSFNTGMESAEAEKASAGKGIWATITSWAKGKWRWLRNKGTKLYIKCVRWKRQMAAAKADRLEAAARYAETKADAKMADANLKSAEKRLAELTKTGGAKDIAEATKDLKYARGDMLSATDRLARADTAYKKGWNLRGIQARLSRLVDALKPSNLRNTWKNVSDWFTSKFKKTPAPAAASSVAADATAEGATSASGAMKYVSKMSFKWWAAIAIAGAAVIGVCIALWRKYKKDDPDGAEAAEKEGDAAESEAEKETSGNE